MVGRGRCPRVRETRSHACSQESTGAVLAPIVDGVARINRTAVVAAFCLLGLGLGGCASDDAASREDAVEQFRAAAAAGASGEWTATYTLRPARVGSSPTPVPTSDSSVVAAHTTAALRLDIRSPRGTATSISTAAGTVACQQPPKGAATCVRVSGPGQVPPAEFSPGISALFSTELAALGAGAGAISPLDSRDTPAGEARCARIEGGTDVTSGVLCLLDDGVPATANYPSGALAITARGSAPATTAFDPPATPQPLPTS